MQHPNKSRLLEFYFQEASKNEMQEIREHINGCHLCQSDLQMLAKTTDILQTLSVENPEPKTVDLILAEIKPVKKKPIQAGLLSSAFPYFQIAFAIPFILAVIYFIQNQLSLSSLWTSLQKFWLIESMGSFGFVAVLFFLLGSFLTLTIAPMLLFNSEENFHFKQIDKLSWR